MGAGVSGLSCAHNLIESDDKEFLLVSADIGGKMKTSNDGSVNYSAWIMSKDYPRIKDFVEFTKSFSVADVTMETKAGLLSASAMFHRHPILSLKLRGEVKEFQAHYEVFKAGIPQLEQIELFRRDPYLERLYKEPALEWIDRKGFAKVEVYLETIVRGLSLANLSRHSASSLLLCLLSSLNSPFEFQIFWHRLVNPIKDHIMIDQVIDLKGTERSWSIHCKSGAVISAEHVVLATPPSVAASLANLDYDVSCDVNGFMRHIKGRIKPPYNKTRVFAFDRDSDDIAIIRNADSSSLLFSRHSKTQWQQYFETPQLIATNLENGVVINLSKKIVPSLYENGLIVIGEANFPGLDACWLTGEFAAREICRRITMQGAA